MKIGIIGLGLIGGSLGRAIKLKTDNEVFAFDLDKDAMIKGKLLQAYDKELNKENAKELDLLFFALYPRAFELSINEYLPFLKKGCTVCDLCGNKTRPVEIMREKSKDYPDINFIGAHPMAGREFSGIAHSSATLFDGASMIYVPVKEDLNLLSKMKEFAISLGFRQVVFTNEKEHDTIIAYTSQLAHLVSSSYIKSPTAKYQRGFSAGSFKDMTRVARLSPEMWTELMMDNAENLSLELGEIIKHLSEYKEALDKKDTEELFKLLEKGNELKLEDLKKPKE